jgi:glucose-6-phosphate isomerase
MSLNPASENPKSVFRAADIVLDSAYQGIDTKGWQSLFAQARSANVEQFIADLFAGKHVNASEDRPALHSALRNLDQKPVLVDGKDVMPAVADVWHRIKALCDKWVGVTDVSHIGIGGSDFGPRLAIEALAHVPDIETRGMRMHFLANIDTAELGRILQRALPQSTRVIIVSKSFTTLETTKNAKAVVRWLKDSGRTDSQIHNESIISFQ